MCSRSNPDHPISTEQRGGARARGEGTDLWSPDPSAPLLQFFPSRRFHRSSFHLPPQKAAIRFVIAQIVLIVPVVAVVFSSSSLPHIPSLYFGISWPP